MNTKTVLCNWIPGHGQTMTDGSHAVLGHHFEASRGFVSEFPRAVVVCLCCHTRPLTEFMCIIILNGCKSRLCVCAVALVEVKTNFSTPSHDFHRHYALGLDAASKQQTRRECRWNVDLRVYMVLFYEPTGRNRSSELFNGVTKSWFMQKCINLNYMQSGLEYISSFYGLIKFR